MRSFRNKISEIKFRKLNFLLYPQLKAILPNQFLIHVEIPQLTHWSNKEGVFPRGYPSSTYMWSIRQIKKVFFRGDIPLQFRRANWRPTGNSGLCSFRHFSPATIDFNRIFFVSTNQITEMHNCLSGYLNMSHEQVHESVSHDKVHATVTRSRQGALP